MTRIRRLIISSAMMITILALTGCQKDNSSIVDNGINETIKTDKTDETVSYSDVQVGDIITMGNYTARYYDKDRAQFVSDEEKSVEWEIVEISDDRTRALLISKYIIDYMPYSNANYDVVWENCSLRDYLNTDFYETVFDESEKSLIVDTFNENLDNDLGVSGGSDTSDKVFILSAEDLYRVYGGDRASQQENRTATGINGESYYISDCWWLRSAGASDTTKCYVLTSGSVNRGGVTGSQYGVRPAITINISN